MECSPTLQALCAMALVDSTYSVLLVSISSVTLLRASTRSSWLTSRSCTGVRRRSGTSWALASTPATLCSPAAMACYTQVAREDFGCRDSCTGLYADVEYTKDATDIGYEHVVEEYFRYKATFARNIQFDGQSKINGEFYPKVNLIYNLTTQRGISLTTQFSLSTFIWLLQPLMRSTRIRR